MDTIFHYVRVTANQGDKARAVQQVLIYMYLHHSTPLSTVRTPTYALNAHSNVALQHYRH